VTGVLIDRCESTAWCVLGRSWNTSTGGTWWTKCCQCFSRYLHVNRPYWWAFLVRPDRFATLLNPSLANSILLDTGRSSVKEKYIII